ncbi:hypothetical protein RJ639_036407 [Escallonia herrerae]|uniref:Serine hydroxymethyltransferase-like domain-containing protein n=1 Tax=Escallonia herrerae TaxID=1293975 RepID=A0AA88WVX8_9ASTE|nr:hypothetical protein RJ639_036407 [Escallonia herrerae]
MASITCNKNSVPGDKSALVLGGIRIGTPAMATRGFTEKDFMSTADFIHEGVQIAREAKRSVAGSKLQDFMKFVASPDFSLMDGVSDVQRRVESLTTEFPLPGLRVTWLKLNWHCHHKRKGWTAQLHLGLNCLYGQH